MAGKFVPDSSLPLGYATCGEEIPLTWRKTADEIPGCPFRDRIFIEYNIYNQSPVPLGTIYLYY
jgi:hypothetical protein